MEATNYAATLLNRKVSIFTACTGAGAGLTQLLWQVPGCSSYFTGSVFPYSQEALENFLGFTPDNVSEDTAMDMAMQSYMEAFEQQTDETKAPVGLGLTASVATTEIHRGDHRVHMAVMCEQGMWVKTWILDKDEGAKARRSDGAFVDDLALIMLVDVIHGDTYQRHKLYGERTFDAFQRLMERPVFWPGGYRQQTYLKSDVKAIFPGAFNPPHSGHFGPARKVRKDLGDADEWSLHEVLFTLCVDPPHKEAVSLADVLKRARMMRGYPFMVTQGDPLYIEKARRNPGIPLVVGADALLRLFDPKWVPDIEALWFEFESLGTLFYVVGRLVDGEWVTLKDVLPKAPEAYRDLFIEVKGRWDISSSAIREGATDGGEG